MSKQIVVLGCHRSGTSMVAGILAKLGVHMGERLIPKDWYNPFGYWEDQEMSFANRRILRDAGGNWRNPPTDEAIAGVVSSELALLVAERDKKYELWGFKDPRTIAIIEHWLPHLDNPVFVTTYRSPHDIVLSLLRRGAMTIYEARELAKYYMGKVKAFEREHDTFCVSYERARREPERWVSAIAAYVGVPVTREAIAHIR